MKMNVNADKALQQIRGMADKALAALEDGVREEAERIMTVSKRQTPVDMGTLRASGLVEPPRREVTKVTVEMSYGGAAAAYALIQHEREDFHHTVGSAKYLERPVNEAQSGFGSRVAKNLEKRLV